MYIYGCKNTHFRANHQTFKEKSADLVNFMHENDLSRIIPLPYPSPFTSDIGPSFRSLHAVTKKKFFGGGRHINAFSLKKFGYSKLKQYLCSTRTRQASQRCSNVRVVLFLYPWLIESLFTKPTPTHTTS